MPSRRHPPSTGRPSLPPDLRLSKNLVLRVLPEDHAAAVAAAAAASLDLATYLRHLLRNRRLPAIAPAPTLAMVRQIARLGNNLNQLTRLAHTGRLSPRLEPLLEDIRDQIDAFRRQLLGLGDDRPSD
jgi:mobilization protein NikA